MLTYARTSLLAGSYAFAVLGLCGHQVPEHSTNRIPMQVPGRGLSETYTAPVGTLAGATSKVTPPLRWDPRRVDSPAKGTITSSVSHFESRSPREPCNDSAQHDNLDDEWYSARTVCSEVRGDSKPPSPSANEMSWLAVPGLDQAEIPSHQQDLSTLSQQHRPLRRRRLGLRRNPEK